MNEQTQIIISNSFEGGTAADFDPQKIGNKTMIYSLNGRVIYNDAGTLSWSNGNGNKLALSIGFNYGADNNYSIIGGIEISNYLILFSTQNNYTDLTTSPPNQKYSEIGILTEQQKGVYVYQTVFNDHYDPNGQLMHLNSRYQIKAQAIFENKDKIRAYWCDDYNEDRVFNIAAGAKSYVLPVAHGSAPAGTTYFATQYSHPYPYWYSVHGMSELADVQFGLIKYQKNIPGAKISGARQYFYRLVHMSGYATPWSTGSGMIFVTVPQVNPTDWTQYSMGNSGTVTSKGHQLEIKYIDERFTFIEVAWAYYSTDKAPQNAGIFFQGLITGPSMIISDINEVVVTPIPDPETLIQRYTDVIHSKTKVLNENYHHKGNVALRGLLEIETSLVTIEPIIRRMGSDITTGVTATPITNGQTTTNDFVNVELFEIGNGINAGQPFNENYILGDSVPNGTIDYINYKGTQWDCLFKGEFRGQAVPLAIVVFSRKGQPFFAQHIGDFTMPDQYGNTWTNQTVNPATGVQNPVSTGITRNNGINASQGDYTLTTYLPTGTPLTNNLGISEFGEGYGVAVNILGKLISGIDLTDILYDQYGDLQVSGFSIVRADRVPNLIAQCLVMNVSNIAGDTVPMLGSGNFIGPLHSTGNAYFTPVTPGSNYDYVNTNIDHGSASDGHGNVGAASTILGGYFTLECPDNLIDPSILSTQTGNGPQGANSGYNLQIVGCVQANFVGQQTITDPCSSNPVTGCEPTHLTFTSFYTKNYVTDIIDTPLTRSDQNTGTAPVGIGPSIGDFGSIADIEKIWLPSVSTVGDSTGIDNFKFSNISFLQDFFFDIDCSGIYHGLGTNTQVVIKSTKLINASLQCAQVVFPSTTEVALGPNPICYYLANIVTGEPQVLNASIIANRIYKNIGHFVPINPTTVAAATQPNGRVVFNQCEVWGGDCYVDYFGYGRLIPLYDNVNKPNVTPKFYDYGCGLVFPIETVNNHTMRAGNTFPSVALRPGADESIAISASPVFNEGLHYNFNDSSDVRLEDFELNAVMQATDEVEAFNVKGIYYVDEPDQPLIEMVSQLKIPGETYDQFRLFFVNNNQPADSQYGWICDLEAIGHNIYVLQEKGFGRIRFNEYTLESTLNNNLTTGTGQGYEGHVYEGGADFGCQHQFSVYNTKKEIFWVNAYKGKDIRFGGNGLECLSDLFGQHSYYTNQAEQYWQIAPGPLTDTNENIYDNPTGVGGIATIYDFRNKSKVNTFTEQLIAVNNGATFNVIANPNIVPSTMEFGNASSHYEGNWSYAANIYFSFKQDFFGPDPLNQNEFYVYNEGNKGSFFGTVFDSELEFIAKASRQFVFDNAEIDTAPASFGVIESFTGTTVNGSQVVSLNTPLTDNRPVYRNSAILFPTMEINQADRLRGSYLDILLTIDNASNTNVLISEYRSFARKDFR